MCYLYLGVYSPLLFRGRLTAVTERCVTVCRVRHKRVGAAPASLTCSSYRGIRMPMADMWPMALWSDNNSYSVGREGTGERRRGTEYERERKHAGMKIRSSRTV